MTPATPDLPGVESSINVGSDAMKKHIQKLMRLSLESPGDGRRGSTLFKRAKLKLGLNRRDRVDSVVADFTELLRLKWGNGMAFCATDSSKNLKPTSVRTRVIALVTHQRNSHYISLFHFFSNTRDFDTKLNVKTRVRV